ncbi:MAG: CotH kinase family protein [Polyangiaceae bacterium]
MSRKKLDLLLATSLALGALGLAGCGDSDPVGPTGGGGSGAGGDAAGGAGGAVDDPGDLYDPSRVIEVSIEIADADAEELANQTRDLLDLLAGDQCLSEPFPSPFTFFPATVTVEGYTREQVGVRKKGFLGSLSTTKPSLKVDFAEFVPDQTIGPYERLTLNNSKQDPSFVRTCLTYWVFEKAGLPAPRCNFAHVVANGNDLGIYVNIEPINSDFVKAHFDDPSGDLYEGTLNDFRPGFDGGYEKETNKSTPGHPRIDALTAALTGPDAGLLDAVGSVVDLDTFYTYWAVEVLTNHWDGYTNNTNNYYVYDDPTSGGFQFVVSGPDGAFQLQTSFQPGVDPPKSVFATGMLARRLYLLPESRDAYLARLRSLLDTVWDENALLAEVDSLEATLAPVADPSFEAALGEVRTFIQGRRAALLAEIDQGPPAWNFDARNSPCMPVLGSVDATFTTTFGSLGSDPFISGDGTISATLGGAPIALVGTAGAVAGLDPNTTPPNGVVIVQVPSLRADSKVEVVVLAIDKGLFGVGQTRFDLFGRVGYLGVFDPADMSFTVSAVIQGDLVLEQAAQTPNAPVIGSVHGQVLDPNVF